MIIHTFPSGLAVDLDRPHISEQYAYEKKQINNHDDLCVFIERWCHFCPSIRRIYNYEEFDKLRNSNLTFYTENYTYKANLGNEYAISYMELLHPHVLTTIYMFSKGSHIDDPERKFKNDGYDGLNEARTFQMMVEAGRIDFDKDGFVRLYRPSSPYDFCRQLENYYELKEHEERRERRERKNVNSQKSSS